MNDLRQPCEPWAERLSLAAVGCLPADEEPAVRGHIATCPACRQQFRQLAELCGMLAEARLPTSDEELAVTERIVSAVACGRRQREIHGPVFPTRRSFDWRWIMRHPMSVVSAAVFLFAVAGVALWFHGGGTSVALADFIQPILEAKTVTFKMTTEYEGTYRETSEVMMLGPSLERKERKTLEIRMRGGHVASESEGGKWQPVPYNSEKVEIWDRDQGNMITLAPALKWARVTTFINRRQESPAFTLLMLDLRSQLRQFQDGRWFKRESLGEKEIGGRRAVGYRLMGHGVVADLWGDPQTGQPIRVLMPIIEIHNAKMTLSDFVFNARLAPSLFNVEPPSGYGYKVESIKEDASPATEKDLIETFRRYSELNGGAFPDTLDFWAMSRFAEKHHPKRKANLNELERQQETQDRFNEDERLYHGLQFVFHQLPPDADPHYAGKGVKRGAADTPIFWYRPKDAKKYRVIYADLSIRQSDTPPYVPSAQAVLTPLSPEK